MEKKQTSNEGNDDKRRLENGEEYYRTCMKDWYECTFEDIWKIDFPYDYMQS